MTNTAVFENGAPRPEELRKFLEQSSADEQPRVSAFVTSPSGHGFADLGKVRLQLRETKADAARQLELIGVEAAQRERLLQPLEELQEIAANTAGSELALPPLPWTLAHYSSAGGARTWHLAVRLPSLARPLVAVSRVPRILPLLEGLRFERSFRALALSVNRVALYEGNARGVKELAAPEVPQSLEAALGSQLESPPDQQQHSVSRAGGPLNRSTTMHHGHGGASAERAVDLERFHRVVADAVTAHWRGHADSPLVLLADATHNGRFRKSHSIPGLVDDVVEGNFDRRTPQEVHAAAWPAIRGRIESDSSELVSDLERARGQGERFTGDLPTLVARALEGRVARLWIAADASRPGRIVEAQAALAEGWPGEDALDQLATIVLRRGGLVHVTEREQTVLQERVAGLLRG